MMDRDCAARIQSATEDMIRMRCDMPRRRLNNAVARQPAPNPPQPFEAHPVLAKWIERLGNSNIEGMSLEHWGDFLGSLNSALDRSAGKPCQTCDGHGLIGGWDSGDVAYRSEPCPHCNMLAVR